MYVLAAWIAAGAALLGAALAYVGARRGSKPEAQAVTQSERDEWGRRFTTAIDLMTDTDERRILMGQALLGALLDSDLAQADDRRIAERLLREAVLGDLPPAALGGRAELAPQATGPRAGNHHYEVDDVQFVEDDGDTAPAEEVR